MAGGRENLKPWPKGQSGNPGGKAKGLEKQARELIGPEGVGECVAFLFRVMRDEEADLKLRIQSTSMLLDRAIGRPRETVDVVPHDARKINWAEVDDETGKLLERALTKILATPDAAAALPDAS